MKREILPRDYMKYFFIRLDIINCPKKNESRWIRNRWLEIDSNRRNEDIRDDVVRRMWKDRETFAFSSPSRRMKRRSLRISTVRLRTYERRKLISASKRVRSRAAFVQWKFTTNDATHAEVKARPIISSSAEKRKGALNGRRRIRSQKRQRERERNREIES